MVSLSEWFEERRTEGLGAPLSLLLIAFGLGGLLWVLFFRGPGAGSSFKGRNVAELRLVDAQGQVHRVGDLRGRVVVLDFWATWCPPCRMSLPEVAALQARQGETYAVVPVSLDQGGFGAVTPFLKANPQLGLFAVVPADRRALEDQVGAIRGIPTTLVLDREGKVSRAWSGYSQGRLERELQAALKER